MRGLRAASLLAVSALVSSCAMPKFAMREPSAEPVANRHDAAGFEKRLEILHDQIDHPDEDVRHTAILALAAAGERRAVPWIVGQLDRASTGGTAAEVIGLLGGPEDASYLIRRMRMQEGSVPDFGPDTLRKMRDDIVILNALGRSRNIGVVYAVIDKIVKDPSMAKELKNELRTKLNDPLVMSIVLPQLRGERGLKNANPDYRAASAFALGWLGDLDSLPRLRDAAENDVNPTVRREAVYALGLIHDPSAMRTFVSALRDADPAVARESALAMANMRASIPKDELLRMLSELNSAYVALALAFSADEGTSDRLIGLLKNRNPSIRASSAYALGLIGSCKAVPALIGALKDAEPVVSSNAELALSVIADERIPGYLIDGYVLSDGRQLLPAIVKLGPKRAIPLIIGKIAQAKDHEKFSDLLGALALSDPQNSSEVLLGFTRNDEPLVRAISILAMLEKLRASDRTSRAAYELLLDPSPKVRIMVISHLGNAYYAYPGTEERVIALMSDPELEIRQLAVNYLGRRKVEKAVPMIAELLTREPEISVRGVAVEALGGIGGKEAIEVLKRVSTSDKDEPIRYAAEVQLRRLKLPELLKMQINF